MRRGTLVIGIVEPDDVDSSPLIEPLVVWPVRLIEDEIAITIELVEISARLQGDDLQILQTRMAFHVILYPA